MSVINNSLLLTAPAGGGYQVSRSLRFNSADSAYLSRTPASAGNRRTWTWSGWLKFSNLTGAYGIFAAPFQAGGAGILSDAFEVWYNAGTINLTDQGTYYFSSAAIFRDPTAWQHFTFACDTTQATASNRFKVYQNGVLLANTAGGTITQNLDTAINKTVLQTIGEWRGTYANDYLAEVNFIDGQALTPSSFTATDATTGQLIPKAYSGGSYGTNGYKLNFSDNSTVAALGTDTSGNGNTWTVNNFSAGSANYVNASAWTLGGSGSAGRSVTDQSNLFDGNTSTYSAWNPGDVDFNQSNWLQWNASGNPIPVPFGATVEIAGNGNGTSSIEGATVTSTKTLTVNGTNFSLPSNNYAVAWINVTSAASTSLQSIRWTDNVTTTDSSINFRPNPPRGPLAIRINGAAVISPVLGSTNDSLVDTPTSYGTDTGVGGEVRGNYCTLNPLNKDSVTTLANGNLNFQSGNIYSGVLGTINIPSSGKWYWEYTLNSNGLYSFCGIAQSVQPSIYVMYYGANGTLQGGVSASGGATLANGDTVGVAVNVDTGTLAFYKNGVSQYSVSYSTSSGLFAPSFYTGTSSQPVNLSANFGQRAFAYTAPSGFKALCDTNLPTGSITTSGSFTGNANADGPFVYLNGVPTAMTINGNAVTFATHADKLANGFKLRSASGSYNTAGSNTYSITTTGANFKLARAQTNP